MREAVNLKKFDDLKSDAAAAAAAAAAKADKMTSDYQSHVADLMAAIAMRLFAECAGNGIISHTSHVLQRWYDQAAAGCI